MHLVAALLALPALLGLSAVVAAPASADASTFVAAVNAERGQRGLAPLSVAGDLSSVAQAWSQQMASSGTLAHNPNLAGQVAGWRVIGENVGYGGTEAVVHQALMNSAPHKANILKPEYSQIGLGIATGRGSVWVTQVFRQPSSTYAAPAPAFQKAGYSPTIYAVTGNSHRAATFSEWAAAGYPRPNGTNTWYVRYPWSNRVNAVTFWADGWQWDDLDYAEWAAAGHPVPRIAGWIQGSSVWKRNGSAAIFLTDQGGQTHQLTYAEWAAAEFRQPSVR